MKAQLSYLIEVADEAQLVLLQTAILRRLNESATVVADGNSIMETAFTVVGLSGSGQRYRTTVNAQDRAEAEAKALATDPTRTIAAVFAGDVTPLP